MHAIDVLTFRTMSKRNRVIAYTLTVILTTLICTAFWNAYLKPDYSKPAPVHQQMRQPAPPAYLIADHLGPKGSYAHCALKWWYLTPYEACEILFQPGTTRDLNSWFKQQGGTALAAVVGTMTTLCTALGLGPLVFLCGLIALYYGSAILWHTAAASDHSQCLRLQYNIFPAVGGVPTAFTVSHYGEWQRWIYVGDRRHWGYPTPCKMPRDCTPVHACVMLKEA